LQKSVILLLLLILCEPDFSIWGKTECKRK